MNTPRFVTAILEWRPTWFLARLALSGAYLLGGVVKLTDWHGAVAEQAHFGMQPGALWAALTIAVEQRRQLLAQVTAREQLFRRNFTESLVGMLLLRRRGDRLEIVDSNDAALRLLGGTGPLVGRYLDRVLDDPDAVRRRTQDMLLGELDGWSAQIGVAQQPDVRLNVAISMISGGPDPAFAAQLLDVTPESLRADWYHVATVASRSTSERLAASFVCEAGSSRLTPA